MVFSASNARAGHAQKRGGPLSAPHSERIHALKLEILRVIEANEHSPIEGYCACWAAFVRMTALLYGDEVARQICDIIKGAAEQKGAEFLASLAASG